MRLPNVKILLRWPSRMHIYGFVENRTYLEKFVSMGVPAHFSIKWSNLIAWGYQHNLHFYGSVGPLECIFMALLALINEGVPAHFFHLIEVPTIRLPSEKMLLHWPSRMHIYGFVENRTFLEQFVSMGVRDHFYIWW